VTQTRRNRRRFRSRLHLRAAAGAASHRLAMATREVEGRADDVSAALLGTDRAKRLRTARSASADGQPRGSATAQSSRRFSGTSVPVLRASPAASLRLMPFNTAHDIQGLAVIHLQCCHATACRPSFMHATRRISFHDRCATCHNSFSCSRLCFAPVNDGSTHTASRMAARSEFGPSRRK
jgi:hypothetical protein